MNPERVTKRQAAIEVLCFVGAGAAFVVSVVLNVPRRYAIATLVVAIVVFIVVTKRRGLEGLPDFGIRRDNFWQSAREVGVFTLLSGAAILAFAGWRGVSFDRPELWVMLPLYPAYGIAQQLVVQGILHRRTLRLSEHRWASVVLTAIGFGLLHAANPPLLALTTAAGLVWAWLFSRTPNVLTLGVSHGVLAALAYPLVIDTNPLHAL